MTTGKKIKKYRTLKGLTQKELGEAVGLSDDRIRHYELGDRVPSKELMKNIAKALDVPTEYLVDRKLEKESDCFYCLWEIVELRGKDFIIKFLEME